MAKFFGVIGFEKTVEKRPGVWSKSFTEKQVTGNCNKIMTFNSNTPNSVNDNITSNNTVTFIADSDIANNLGSLKYVKFYGYETKWKINSISIDRPSITITLGGVFND